MITHVLFLGFSLIAALVGAQENASRKTCTVPSYKNASISDTPRILETFNKCRNGGKIVFSRGVNYTIGELTVLKGCRSCEVIIDGTIRVSDNLNYWNSSESTTLNFAYQSSHAAFAIQDWKRGKIHSLAGTGTIDGAGQRWWDAEAANPGILRRPHLFTIWQSEDVTVHNIYFKDPAKWNNFIIESDKIEYRYIRMTAKSTSKEVPRNSDGWDTYRSSNVKILDSHLVVGDDCFSFKPNSTNIEIRNLYCEGTHGVSVGSLAEYKGTYDIVKNAVVENITFVGGSNAFRIKTWAGDRGKALVENIHYKDIKVTNVSEGITLDGCYFSSAECEAFPSKVNIFNVTVTNLTGTTLKQKVASLVCGKDSHCDLEFQGVDLKPADGSEPIYSCKGLTSEIGLPCTPVSA